jgi:hypothetical protein
MATQPDIAEHDGDEVTTIAETTFVGPPVAERYTVEQTRDGIVLTCSVFKVPVPDTFFIPDGMRAWFAEHILDRREGSAT